MIERFRPRVLVPADIEPYSNKPATTVEARTVIDDSIRGEVLEIRIDPQLKTITIIANVELVNCYGLIIGMQHQRYHLRFGDPRFVSQSNSEGRLTLRFKSWGETVTLSTPASPDGA